MSEKNPKGRPELWARIADLEQRLQLLEAKVRQVAAQAQRDKAAGALKPKARLRPRCPGCLLELPKGRRKESCVWCGFVFETFGHRSSRGSSR